MLSFQRNSQRPASSAGNDIEDAYVGPDTSAPMVPMRTGQIDAGQVGQQTAAEVTAEQSILISE